MADRRSHADPSAARDGRDGEHRAGDPHDGFFDSVKGSLTIGGFK
jgi:hypothetical protein